MSNISKSIDLEKKEIQASEDTERTRDTRVFVPKADIYEENDKVFVVVDMPGTDENNIDITVEKNVLTIEGIVQKPIEGKYTPIYTEYGIGDYHRSFRISEDIDKNNINATVKDGILTLILSKSKEAAAKKITVKAQ